MAAIFALIFLFVVGSVGFMVKTVMGSGFSLGSTLALSCFVAMASGLFYGLFRLARRWEDEEPTTDWPTSSEHQ